MTDNNTKLLHHLATAVGLLFLGGWFLLFKHLGVLDWIIGLVPESHAGAGLMLGIALVMLPAFFIWKLYNRWVERRLQIRGIFYEDHYYGKDEDGDER